ncbi:MAG: phenylalanine--tRNA ligase subunit beta [Capnocytophaga sp.]|uniref:phenylalanine--tRNA ligase subunit beta n=1 Tax=Capnocytophaga sp. TaxID=44737 RepID=UPI003F9F2B2D
MKISYNWLKQYLKVDLPVEETAVILTDLGLEVEGIELFESVRGGLKGVVVGLVLECEKHPNADKLNITKVDVGGEAPLQIVCGAPNVAKGQKVPVATIGTVLYDKDGKPFEIKKGKIRGEESFGMICAEDELGLGESHDGIMVLDDKIAVGTPCSKVFDVETDNVFEIGLTPNRADAMSHYGVARDLRAGLIQKGTQLELITPSVTKFHVDNRSAKVDIEVLNKKLVPRYTGVTISNIRVASSPAWLQNRLKAIGVTPKNNVVDATNYVLHALGQPLHAFDADHIVGRKIIVKTADEGMRFTTLDGVERTLSAEDIIVCDAEKPLCLAGVLGGQNSGVNHSTRNIFLESAYFDSVAVRKTAKRHSISTDASYRFERGINIDECKFALMYAALLIEEIAGGVISSEVVDLYPKKQEDFQVFLTFDKVDRVIGQKISHDTIKSILHSLDVKINSVTERGLGLLVPSYRVDVQREADVIEEILRIYGYNNIGFSEKVNATMAHSSKYDDHNMQNVVATQLIGQGFFEIMTNSLVSEKEITTYAPQPEQAVKLLNPLSTDLGYMRKNLLFSGLEVIAYNINRKRTDLKLFEFGKNYHFIEGKYSENKHLTVYLTGNKQAEHWADTPKKATFFELKGVIEAIFERIGLHNLSVLPLEAAEGIASEGFRWVLGEQLLGTMGVVKNKILKEVGIKQEVLFADLCWEAILEQVKGYKVRYKEIAKYPEVRRDLALLLDDNITFADIYRVAFSAEKDLLKSLNLFDVYQGDKLPQGKKSYAVSFTLQDNAKTLTDKQIDKTMQRLQTAFEQQLGAALRE